MSRALIRFGGLADLDEAMTTMVEAFDPAFGEAWTARQLADVLDLTGVWLALATIEGQAAGFALNRSILDDAELLLLAVRPAVRGAGIGRGLLAHSCATARSRGARSLHLEMREGNPAGKLYETQGFVTTGRRRAYYRSDSGQLIDAISLHHDLVPIDPPQ